jgi:hypothetical protein
MAHVRVAAEEDPSSPPQAGTTTKRRATAKAPSIDLASDCMIVSVIMKRHCNQTLERIRLALGRQTFLVGAGTGMALGGNYGSPHSIINARPA